VFLLKKYCINLFNFLQINNAYYERYPNQSMEKAELLHKDIMIKFAANRKKPTDPESIRNTATALKFYLDMAQSVEENCKEYYGAGYTQKPIVIRYEDKVLALQ